MGDPDPPGPPPGGLCRETSALYGVRRPRITLLRRSVHTLLGTGYTHGASRVNVTSFCSVLFCVHLQIDIHVSLNRDVGNTKGC